MKIIWKSRLKKWLKNYPGIKKSIIKSTIKWRKKDTLLKMQSTGSAVTVTSDDIIGVGTNVTTSVLDSKYQNIILKEIPEITPARSLMPATILVSGYNVAKEANKKDGDPIKQATIEVASAGTSVAVYTVSNYGDTWYGYIKKYSNKKET